MIRFLCGRGERIMTRGSCDNGVVHCVHKLKLVDSSDRGTGACCRCMYSRRNDIDHVVENRSGRGKTTTRSGISSEMLGRCRCSTFNGAVDYRREMTGHFQCRDNDGTSAGPCAGDEPSFEGNIIRRM